MADGVDAFHIVRHYLYFLSQVTDMVVDKLAGIAAVILLPDQVRNHCVGVHMYGVPDEQREVLKFLTVSRIV